MASAVEARSARILQEHTRRGGSRPARTGEVRALTLWDRRGLDPRAAPVVIEVIVSAACPAEGCGMLRGEPTTVPALDHFSQTEAPLSYWRNDCGHLDLHTDVIEEAERYRLAKEA